MTVENGHLALKPERFCDVVAVHTCHVLSGDVTEAPVEVLGQTHVLLILDNADAVIVDGAYHLNGIVGRTVVNDQQLEVAVGLSQHAVDSLPNIGGHVICRHQNSYFGHIISPQT